MPRYSFSTLRGINLELTGKMVQVDLGKEVWGNDVWTDGKNIYYNNIYKFNKKTQTWEDKIWYGLDDLSDFRTTNLWTDGIDIYYSYNDTYKLNKKTDTWEKDPSFWPTGASAVGEYIWSDGINTYYSNKEKQYVLNKETFTWEPKTWNGLTSFSAYEIWHWPLSSEDKIYISPTGKYQYYQLNKETDTWESKTGWKTWVGGGPGSDTIFTDGKNVYWFYDTHSYVLDKEIDDWEVKQWDGLNKFTNGGRCVWSDGQHLYYSQNQKTYMFETVVSNKVVTKSALSSILTKFNEKFDNRYTKEEIDALVGGNNAFTEEDTNSLLSIFSDDEN